MYDPYFGYCKIYRYCIIYVNLWPQLYIMYCWKDVRKSFEVLQEQNNFFKLMFLPWLVQCIFRGSISAVNGFCHDCPQRRAASLRALNCLTNLRYVSFTARSRFFLAFFCYFHIIAYIFCLSVKALQKYTLLLETSFPRYHRPGLWQDEKQDEAKKWNFSKCFRTVWHFQASTVQNVSFTNPKIQGA